MQIVAKILTCLYRVVYISKRLKYSNVRRTYDYDDLLSNDLFVIGQNKAMYAAYKLEHNH